MKGGSQCLETSNMIWEVPLGWPRTFCQGRTVIPALEWLWLQLCVSLLIFRRVDKVGVKMSFSEHSPSESAKQGP